MDLQRRKPVSFRDQVLRIKRRFKTRFSEFSSLFLILLVFMTWINSVVLIYFNVTNNARIINLAGKQRMLTQKMTKEIFIISMLNDSKAKETHIAALRNAQRQFSITHHALRFGNATMGIPATTSKKIIAQWEKVDVLWEKFKDQLEHIIQTKGKVPLITLTEFNNLSDQLLIALDTLVSLFEEHATYSNNLTIGGSFGFSFVFSIFTILFVRRRHIFLVRQKNYLLAYQHAVRDILKYLQHEIRSPLNRFQMALHILKKINIQPNEQNYQLTPASNVTKMINELNVSYTSFDTTLKQLTKITHAELYPPLSKIKTFDIVTIIQHALATIKEESQKNNIPFQYHLTVICPQKPFLKRTYQQSYPKIDVFGYSMHFHCFFYGIIEILKEFFNVSELQWIFIRFSAQKWQWIIISEAFSLYSEQQRQEKISHTPLMFLRCSDDNHPIGILFKKYESCFLFSSLLMKHLFKACSWSWASYQGQQSLMFMIEL